MLVVSSSYMVNFQLYIVVLCIFQKGTAIDG